MRESLLASEAEASARPRQTVPLTLRQALLMGAATGFGLLCWRGRAAPGEPVARVDGPRARSSAPLTDATHHSTALIEQGRIFVIRHGEKSPDFPNDLDSRGRSRAELIADDAERLFDLNLSAPGGLALFARFTGSPAFQYREVETLQPLSRRLGVPVNTAYDVDQEESLAAAVFSSLSSSSRSVAIVAWEHCRLPRFLQALGCATPDCVHCWADGEFDQYFEFTVSSAPTARSVAVRKRFEGFGRDDPETLQLRASDPGPVNDDRYQCFREARESNLTLAGRFQCVPDRAADDA